MTLSSPDLSGDAVDMSADKPVIIPVWLAAVIAGILGTQLVGAIGWAWNQSTLTASIEAEQKTIRADQSTIRELISTNNAAIFRAIDGNSERINRHDNLLDALQSRRVSGP